MSESTNPKPSEAVEVVAVQATSGARRRLLRGTFALPAIMTVASGSAVAASSNTRCLANQISNPEFPAPTASPTTESPIFLRVELAALVGSNPEANTYYVRGATVSGLNRSAFYTLSATQWQVFNFAGNTDVGGAILTTEPTDPNRIYTANSGQFAVLRFDSAGLVVGVGSGPTGTSAVTHSCWTSF